MTPGSSIVHGAFTAIVSRDHRVVVAAHVVHARAELRVRVEKRLVLLFGAAVGEVALHDDRVGIERLDLGDRARVHHVRVRLVAGRGAQDRTELLGRAEPAALDLAEVHVVDGRERREQRARRAAASVVTRPGSSSVASAPSTRSVYSVSGSSPVTRAEWYGPRRGDLVIADDRRDRRRRRRCGTSRPPRRARR